MEFGAYQLRPGAGLFRDAKHVPVPPKELELLRLLLRLDGRVASHTEIQDGVWPGQVVSNESITRCVYSLRCILGTDRGAYVETVPRRGYRFAPAIRRVEQAESARTLAKMVRTVPLAWSHYLEGLREANCQEPDAQARAVERFEEAHRVDGSYALPLAAIADCRIYQIIRGHLSPAEGERLGRRACGQALSIDPHLAAAHAALAWFEGVVRRNADAGLEMLAEVLAADRDYARAYSYRAWILRGAGRTEQALASVRRAVELDPHSLLNRHALAWTL